MKPMGTTNNSQLLRTYVYTAGHLGLAEFPIASWLHGGRVKPDARSSSTNSPVIRLSVRNGLRFQFAETP